MDTSPNRVGGPFASFGVEQVKDGLVNRSLSMLRSLSGQICNLSLEEPWKMFRFFFVFLRSVAHLLLLIVGFPSAS